MKTIRASTSPDAYFIYGTMLGMVQISEGLPLWHEVFEGNTAEVTTIKGVIEKIVARFPIKRVIAVAAPLIAAPNSPSLV